RGPGLPVGDQSYGRLFGVQDSGKKQALAVGAHVEVREDLGNTVRVEEAFNLPDGEIPSLDLGLGQHYISTRTVIDDLLAIGSPAGRAASTGGDLPFPIRNGERSHIDLKAAAFVRAVDQPLAV